VAISVTTWRTGAVVAAIVLATPCRGEEWPSRPIRVIVPFPAGGSTDVGARLVGEVVGRALGQQVYVENKSGASGSVGIETVAKSAPDGYTVLITSDQVISAPHIVKVNYDPLKDLAPVIQLSRQPVVLAVHPSLGVDSLAGFVALAKSWPGMSYASSGIGSQQHFTAAWFAHIAGIKLDHVPYRGGGQAINDLLAGHVKIGSLGSSPVIPHYVAGTLRILAQSTATRAPSLPEVPTYQEAGVTGLEIDQWIGVFLPAGAPAAIADRLNGAIGKALTDPAVERSLLESAQEPVGGSAAQFAALVTNDYEKYARLVRELNIGAN
jgi:tripartite-type tricarboxylate transporter receptor subunit TctC